MQTPQKPADENERQEAVRGLALGEVPEERFDRITRLAARTLDAPIVLLSIVDADRQWFKSRCGLQTAETPRDVSFCGHAILSPEIMVVRDALADIRFADNPLVFGPPGIRFYAARPLRAPGGQRVGTLCVIDRKAREFSAADRATLEDLAALAEDELGRVGVPARTDRSPTQVPTAAQLPIGMFEADLGGRWRSVNARWCELAGLTPEASLEHGWVDAIHPEDRMRIAGAWLARAERPFSEEFRLVRASGEICWVEVHAGGVRDGDGHPTGWLGTVTDITERKAAEARHDALATTDPATGLPNARQLEDRLVQEVARTHRYGGVLTAALFDIDRFAAVNETFGRELGDAVLAHVGDLLRRRIRTCDMVARLDGDRFCVLFPETPLFGAMTAAEYARRFVVEHPHQLPSGMRVRLTLSVGVAELGNHSDDAAGLLRSLEAAVDAAKREGRNRVVCVPSPLDAVGT